MNRSLHRRVGALVLAGVVLAPIGCGNDADTAGALPKTADATAATERGDAGVRLVPPEDAAAILADPPTGLVVLDVRTPEEFAEGHIAGAQLLDFYAPDFAARLAELDPDAPYVLYCRSGNRSGQTRAQMSALGFTDVADIDGGIVNWVAAGQPVAGS
jgi:rhodanese-related sulfurtransferase